MSEDEKDHIELARLRTRCELLESLLSESLRLGYVDFEKCSPTWLKEAQEATKR